MNYIVDPVNRQSFSIFSEQGKALLKNVNVKMYQRCWRVRRLQEI